MAAPEVACKADSSRADAGQAFQVYALALLAAVAFFYQLDRNAMFITQEMIKGEFRLTDTQLGLLTGAAYGLSNGLAAVPIGWLADRVNRKRLIAAIVALWSGMTALCGVAGGYAQMLVARIAVGASEAGGTPTSMSILIDLYPPQERASKVGLVFAGYSMGSIVAGFAGGFIAARFGWRAVFLSYGLPGLLLGLLILATMREPARTRSDGEPPIPARGVPAAFAKLLVQPGLRMIYAAVALTSLIANGVFSWWTSFMMRVHHLPLPTVGVVMALGPGLCGIIGMVLTGVLADRARRRSAGGPLFVVAIATLVNFASASLAIWCPGTGLMLVALCIAGGTAGAYTGPGNAVVSEIAPPHLRGMAFSISVVLTNLVGAALGPTVIGAVSDFARAHILFAQPLRIAMFTVLLAQIPVALIYLIAAFGLGRRDRAAGAA